VQTSKICILIKFVDDTKLRVAINMLEDMTMIQKDFYRLKEWASRNVRELKNESHRPASVNAEQPVLVQLG